MKVYTGSPAAARNYVEADRGRADDYYLAEGTGVAQRYTASPEAGVRRLAPLGGDGYEAWVAGVDPDTGAPKGRLRNDEKAVRFVEVTVNGPKSWSLAAELHPDIGAAYDAAQEGAAGQIIAWLAQHATTRVGPRGAQVQVPVQAIEAVTVRHYTSRAGDPHRHLHLQISSRVFAENTWRGLHTVGVRDSLDAINGVGHAAVMTDPAFRQALAAHGFTLNGDGEVVQLAPFVGPFSARAAQIARNIARYESDWRDANPGREPGVGRLRSWDARAWADGRPDKVIPQPGVDIHHRWLAELGELGYRDPDVLFDVVTGPVGARTGELDRDQAVEHVLARLAKRRSGWNAADIRGEVEQLIARRNVVTDAAVRAELAEDLTARTLAECIPILDWLGVPEHIRTLTSPHVLQVEADLTWRLAALANARLGASQPGGIDAVVGLDAAQRDVVAALGGEADLLVIEGAAGSGKTTTLAAARTVIERQGARLRLVTPTLKAARVAAEQVGTDAGSAAWLGYQHGFRWDEHGVWTRLVPGARDPDTGGVFRGPSVAARLRRGDVLLVDEAGMLDQDTAHALLTIADEHHARLALVGDRHQLPAVGRGGVLDLAARWAAPDARLTLDTVHRFTRTHMTADGVCVSVADDEYAQLSLAMRTGTDPEKVFDALLARDQIRVHPADADRVSALAAAAVDALTEGVPAVVVADTNEQVAALNAAIRDRLIAAGRVDDAHATTTNCGQRIGLGDRVATRRNNTDLGVANRDTWTVTHIARDGHVTLAGEHGDRTLPPDYVREHVELAYASTVHGVQGDTATAAHSVIGDHTSAASAYVAMTRGRETNVAHLVADSVEAAREQWIATFARDRADLGAAHAAELAATEAARYATGRPVELVLAELHDAWETQARCVEWLERGVPVRDRLAEIVVLRRAQAGQLAPAAQRYETATRAAVQATAAAEYSETVITAQTAQCHDALTAEWNAQLGTAREHARVVLAGPGRFGWKRGAVNRATEQLARWSTSWQPVLPDMPTSTGHIAFYADRYIHEPHLHAAFDRYARHQVEQAHPEHQALLDTAEQAAREREQACYALSDTRATHHQQLHRHGRLADIQNPDQRLAQLDRDITSTEHQLADAHTQIRQLTNEPAIASRAPEYLATEHASWQTSRDTERQATQRAAAVRAERAEAAAARQHATPHSPYQAPAPGHGPSIGR